MAYVKGKSGSFVINGTKNLDFKVYWEETYELESNTSIVVLKPYCIIQQSGGGVRYYLDGTISCNGTAFEEMDSYSGTHYFDAAYQTEKQVIVASNKTQYVLTSNAIAHNADGSKSVSIAANFYIYSQGAVGINAAQVSGAQTITLTSIPRGATIATAPNFNDEQNPTITYSNPAGTAVTSIKACIANSTGGTVYVAYRDISKTGTSYTFNLTEAERNVLRNATKDSNTMTVQFYIETVIGGQTFRSNMAKTLTIINNKPTLSPTIVDTGIYSAPLTGDANNKIIKGYNTMSITFGDAALKGATITSRKVTCGSLSRTADGTMANVESGDFVFTVTDSRGNTTTKTISKTLINYVKLTANLDAKNPTTDGVLNFTVKGNYFNGNFGANSNTLTVQYRYKVDGGSYSQWTTVSHSLSSNTYTVSSSITGLDYQKAYVIQCRALDKIYNDVGEDAVLTIEAKVKSIPVFDWSGEDFNFNVPVTIQGNPVNDFVIATGSEAMGSNGTWYWRKWASGRAECYGVRNFGNMAVSTAWGSIYYSAAFTQSLPSGLFTDAPEVCDISFRGSSADWAAFIIPSVAPTKTTSSTFYVARPASATISAARISFNVIGRWK